MDIEVKGHKVEVRDGVWRHAGRTMDPQPCDQARKNAYALRDLLVRELPDIEGVRTSYGVALPNTTSYEGKLPTDIIREQILTLPPDTLICPGHGPLTTVAEEKANNPFF